ncbi:MAG: tetratricopeptide repeat protein [Bacteroidota bacterium]
MKNYIILFILTLSYQFAFTTTNTIQVLSAVIKDKKIEGAEVFIQKNGAQTAVGTTDVNGQVVINTSFEDDLNSLIIIKKEGYSTLVAKCACNGLTYAISPIMTNLDGIRIVLSWGKNPEDLDSHLGFTDNHIYWQHKIGVKANLDVDDVDSYGPETITIDEKKNGEEYIYAVHNYSQLDQPNSMGLSTSQAKVFVYIGSSLVRSYYVPQNKIGNLWSVFKIKANGEFEDINSISGINIEPKDINMQILEKGASIIGSVVTNEELAKSYNAEGEAAYHNQDYDRAITLYQLAIEQYPNYGQAYGNLGLAYKKKNLLAEAIWANRKAISLASGATANTVRAGSYYNIARIYEDKGEYSNALQYYQLAKSQKENTVYDNAIVRVKAKL